MLRYANVNVAFLISIAILVTTTTCERPAIGAVIVSNLQQPSNGGSPIVTDWAWIASSFTTGPTSRTFESATLRLFTDSRPGTYTWNAAIHLRAVESKPGLMYEDLGLQSITNDTGASVHKDITFTGSGTRILNPNTIYFLVLHMTDVAGGGLWQGTASTEEASSDGWKIGDITFRSMDSGASWGGSWAVPNAVQYSIQDTTPTVPEPTTLASWLIAGITGLAAAAWRRVRRP